MEGDESSQPILLAHPTDLECWAGNWQAAERYAAQGGEVGEQVDHRVWRAAACYARALIDAHLGRIDAAQAEAADGLSVATAAGDEWAVMMLHAALGFAELSAGNLSAAEASLSVAAGLAGRIGLAEPAAWRFRAYRKLGVTSRAELGAAMTRRESASLLRYDKWQDRTLRATELQAFRWQHWSSQEFEQLLAEAGFADVRVTADYQDARTSGNRQRRLDLPGHRSACRMRGPSSACRAAAPSFTAARSASPSHGRIRDSHPLDEQEERSRPVPENPVVRARQWRLPFFSTRVRLLDPYRLGPGHQT